jgi:hypothetical protein
MVAHCLSLGGTVTTLISSSITEINRQYNNLLNLLRNRLY